MRVGRLVLAAAILVATVAAQVPPAGAACPRCGWRPPASRRDVVVSNVQELERAIGTAQPGDAILLSDGRYPLRHMIDIGVPNVTIRSASRDPSRVVVHGGGMTNDTVGVALSISAGGVTIADLTIRDVGYHAIQVRGERGASGFTLHNARLIDTGQQMLKGSLSSNGRFADDGLVACSEFSYTVAAPTNYTNGVDLIGVKGWLIRDNRFLRIRGPEGEGWKAGPAVMTWGASEDTVVERNLVADSFRGIALGLAAGSASVTRRGETAHDHLRGVVRNNVIVNLHDWADEAIEVNAGREARIEHNSVLVEGSLPWSVGVRYRAGSARIVNNLLSKPVRTRDGGTVVLAGNVDGAARAWFVDAPRYDLHLSAAGFRAVDAGVPVTGLPHDFDRQPRVAGKAPDAGAFERRTPGR